MKICIYGASSDSINRIYLEAGEWLGREMALRGHEMVFGGGASGLMGAAARGITAQGGRCTGVAPHFFNVDGILFEGCAELILTDTMRERKHIMEERSDAYVMTPGGTGTFEEFFEVLTLRQLGKLQKPIAIYNTAGYFDELLAMLHAADQKGFLRAGTLDLFGVYDDPVELLEYLEKNK